ncbi:MAG: DUF5615 family PIN-like protein [Pyrinomonadaceae bacterium]
MKFLVDAQLPRRLVRRLREAGHEALHMLDFRSAIARPTWTSMSFRRVNATP